MSTRGPPNADVIMAFDDVSIDQVNVDQVNGSTGFTSSGVHMSGLGKGKRKDGSARVTRLKAVAGRLNSPTKLGLAHGSKEWPARFTAKQAGSGTRLSGLARAAARGLG